MSRRFAADKRPNGQTLQGSESLAQVRGPRGQGDPNGKAKSSRPFEGAVSPAETQCHGSLGFRPATFPQRSFSPKTETIDFRKCLQKNVFIDSYYPMVQGDCSESSRRSHSSYEDTDEPGSQTDSPKTEDSWETGSRETFKMAANFSTSNDSNDSGTNFPPPSTLNRSRHKSRSSVVTSFPTIDSRTYTVLSSSSDLESVSVKDNHPQNDDEVSGNCAPAEDCQDPPVVGCFTQLYKRIHNLEGLLQETLAKSVHLRERNCTTGADGEGEKRKSRNKLQRAKSRAAGVARAWESTCLSIPEVSDERGNSDTDSELQNIKKRLKVLEGKLREAKQRPLQSFPMHRNPHDPLASSSLMFAGIGGRCCGTCKLGKSKDTDSTAPLCSETESFLQNEVLLLNSGSYERKEVDSWDRKARTKVRRKFISKCRGIRRKCSNLVNSSKRNPSNNNPVKLSAASGWSEVLYKRSILTEESVETTLLSQSFSANTKTDSSTVVYLRCQHEGLLEPQPKARKKNGKKRKYLCKKNSKINILSTFNANTPKGELMLRSTPTTDAFVFGDYDLPPADTIRICDSDKNVHPKVWAATPWQGIPGGDSVAWNSHRFISFQDKCCRPPPDRQCGHWQPENRHCAHWQPENRRCSLKPDKPPKKPISFRNPVDLLKRGGQIKIPVLFEEVCKTAETKQSGHKQSNVSMRFVVVEEDDEPPLTPLRKLIKKLSQTKPSHKREHFVFGVSRCHCDSQVNPISQRNVTSGFS